MKNNHKTFILSLILIIFFLSFKVSSKEPFNFDITEIEITNNGNIFKGLKRGTASSDSGLIIEADRFEYNKSTNILNAFGNVEINDQINDYKVFANDITYLKTIEKIYTKGKTKAIMKSKYDFLSKDIILLRNEKELYSSEFTIVKDNNLTQYNLDEFKFFIEKNLLKGKNIDVISDYTKYPKERDFYKFKDGIFNLKTKNYNASDTKIFLKKNTFGHNLGSVQLSFKEEDKLAMSGNDPRIYGVSSSKNNDITIINKGTFTSCGFNDKCPPWHIRSQKITHNQSKKKNNL